MDARQRRIVLLAGQGALFPALQSMELEATEVRRAWSACCVSLSAAAISFPHFLNLLTRLADRGSYLNAFNVCCRDLTSVCLYSAPMLKCKKPHNFRQVRGCGQGPSPQWPQYYRKFIIEQATCLPSSPSAERCDGFCYLWHNQT